MGGLRARLASGNPNKLRELARALPGWELELLGADGYLLNVSRGAVVDEEALYEALAARRIAGAALDVWWRYPERRGARTDPSRFPFGQLDNVLMTPHVSGRTVGTERGRRELVVRQLGRLARGERLENVVATGR
jgi:phosphoglycerate dehydrogenase-like enzyme